MSQILAEGTTLQRSASEKTLACRALKQEGFGLFLRVLSKGAMWSDECFLKNVNLACCVQNRPGGYECGGHMDEQLFAFLPLLAEQEVMKAWTGT